MRLAGLLAAMFPVVSCIAAADEGPFVFEFEELAPGVIAGVRPDGPRFPVMGSTLIVIGEERVIVFDGGGAATMADQIIAKVREETDAPVSHVVISHWHGDHSFGAYRFREEFPDVNFVAQDFTYRAMRSTVVNYVFRASTAIERNLPQFLQTLETGLNQDGEEISEIERQETQAIVDIADAADVEYKRMRLTEPELSFDNRMVIDLGGRSVELLWLGAGNTEGDAVIWLPDEKIVATGDLVVLPSPYAFNVPPRAWSETLRRLNDLEYNVLVPGHGDIQRDTSYVDLLIDAATSVADQRDAMIADGVAAEEISERLDFSAFKDKFAKGDKRDEYYYYGYFEGPLRAAAVKELSGEPMVALVPRDDAAVD